MKRLTLWALLTICCGCNSEVPEPVEPEIPVDPNPVSQAEENRLGGEQLKSGPFEHRVKNLVFQVPEGWHQLELTASQKSLGDDFYHGRFAVPAAGTESEVTISLVPGGIPANIARWRGLTPVSDPEEIELDIQGKKVQYVDYSGEAPPQVKSRVLGAGIPLDETRDCYVKLTGQPTAVRQVRDQFRQFIETLKVE